MRVSIAFVVCAADRRLARAPKPTIAATMMTKLPAAMPNPMKATRVSASAAAAFASLLAAAMAFNVAAE